MTTPNEKLAIELGNQWGFPNSGKTDGPIEEIGSCYVALRDALDRAQTAERERCLKAVISQAEIYRDNFKTAQSEQQMGEYRFAEAACHRITMRIRSLAPEAP